ncbi:hypothetical protein SAMN02745166_00488 [Prosthecobacter debontii]|uniref:Uncharacterized protein n=1 Tax=Prosthecobacter debontii TaxID=48467 RepID=A0A1T4WN11_9BACT|nr:hypothetical protein SAMN02745166_00488 [Prosthecobacter debontii]
MKTPPSEGQKGGVVSTGCLRRGAERGRAFRFTTEMSVRIDKTRKTPAQKKMRPILIFYLNPLP